MTDLDDLPNSARRALAARSMLAVHGFTDAQVFLGIGIEILRFPAPEGSIHLAVMIVKDGNPLEAPPDFLWPCGPIDAAWWASHGPPFMVEAWNALTPEVRLRERNKWISPEDEIRLAAALRAQGLLPPIRDSDLN